MTRQTHKAHQTHQTHRRTGQTHQTGQIHVQAAKKPAATVAHRDDNNDKIGYKVKFYGDDKSHWVGEEGGLLGRAQARRAGASRGGGHVPLRFGTRSASIRSASHEPAD